MGSLLYDWVSSGFYGELAEDRSTNPGVGDSWFEGNSDASEDLVDTVAIDQFAISPLAVEDSFDLEEDDTADFALPLADLAFEPEQADSMAARELYQLTQEDREQVFFDLHGVSPEIQETPTLIEERLHQLCEVLGRASDAHAYQQALMMNPTYVHNPKFLLRFLRADRFDVKAAAERIINHFKFKLEFFAPALLAKDIVQDDLDEEDLNALYQADSTHDLPVRDRSGRLVVFQNTLAEADNFSLGAKIRKGFYISMVASEDEETQKKGIVMVSYNIGSGVLTWNTLSERRKYIQLRASLASVTPIRLEAMHFCFDSIVWKVGFAMAKRYAPSFNRVRIREHHGSPKDILFHLQTFGIPTGEGFPVTADGTVLQHLHIERWERRRRFEALQAASHLTVGSQVEGGCPPVRVGTPRRSDVLLGRGKACYLHFGNMRMRDLVLERGHLYESASYLKKSTVVRDLVQFMKQGGVRFLQDDGISWVEVDDAMAEKKVSGAFRTLRGIQRGASISAETNPQAAKRATKRQLTAA